MKEYIFKNFDSFYFRGFFLVLIAGLLWSFGAIIVRYMIDANLYQPQYLFYRGISIAIILCFYLFIKEGKIFYKNFNKIGKSGVFGGFCLAIAFTGFIFSITMTTAAVTLFMLAAMPFIAAVVSYFTIKEKLRLNTLIAMIIALIGVLIMIINDSIDGSALGAILGFVSATGFAIYTVTIRWRPETPKFTTVVLAGLFCSIISLVIIIFKSMSFSIPTINIYLSLLHGSVVASGLILYSLGAKNMPAAELALLSLMEVVGGIIWVWLPILGINEIPSLTTVIGGSIVTLAVIIHAFGARKKKSPVTL